MRFRIDRVETPGARRQEWPQALSKFACLPVAGVVSTPPVYWLTRAQVDKMMAVDEMPRALTIVESKLLAQLLSVEFPGVDELRLQAESAMVVGGCKCGCPSVELDVPDGVAVVDAFRSRLVPAEGVIRPMTDGVPGEIILFVDEGRLSYLEYVYYGEVPTEWPAMDRITVVVQPR